MLKFSKKEWETLETAAAAVRELYAELEVEREIFDGKRARLLEQIGEAKADAVEVLEDAASATEDYYDGKSETWQEGGRGGAYCEWKERLRQLADDANDSADLPELEEVELPSWVDEMVDPDLSVFEYDG